MADYPMEWESHEVLADGLRVLVRPLKPDDEALYPDFIAHVTAEDARLRFFHAIREISPEMLKAFVSIDYWRAMAFAAIGEDDGKLLGVSRLHCDPFHSHGEYAVIVRSDLKGHGLGWLLMQRIIEWARRTGLERVHGQVLADNTSMLRMAGELGFQVTDEPSDRDIKVVTLALNKD